MKKIYFYLLSMLLIISISSSAQSSNNLERLYQQAWDYYKGENGKRQDIEQALSLFAQAAEQGHVEAQLDMAVFFHEKEQYTQAMLWYRKAADAGYAMAQFAIGNMYELGDCGLTQDMNQALYWYRKSAEQGFASAQYSMAVHYINNEKNYAEGAIWLRKAAEQGHDKAQFHLGAFYENGLGVEKNLEEAKRWYQKSAEQGNEDAKKKILEHGHSTASSELIYERNSRTYTAKVCGVKSQSIKSVDIPETITWNGSKYTVIEIGEEAFKDCTSLESITIPSSVTRIGRNAFYLCISLEITNYEGSIAQWCDIEFQLPNSNPALFSEKLYINNQLVTNLVIPSGVKRLKNYAFYKCKSLKSVTIPSSVMSVGKEVFDQCYDIEAIYYEGSIAQWCDIEFKTRWSNPIYYSNNLYINNQLVTNLVIPSGVKRIKNYAFYKCKSLKSVTILNSVTSIGDVAFNGCSGLTSVTIPNSVKKIGFAAFYDCESLRTIYFNGTKQQWREIEKGKDWKKYSPAKIIYTEK